MSSDKALPADQTENVRALLRKLVNDDFGGVILRASEKLKLSRSLIKEILDGGRGAGNKTLTALSDYTGRTRDDILNGVERDPTPREGDALGDHPDYRAREADWWLATAAVVHLAVRDGGALRFPVWFVGEIPVEVVGLFG